jgi:hypothetical protein
MSAGPTAQSLVEELRQHMVMLLTDPAPVAKAPDHFLQHWLLILDWIAALVENHRGH